MTSTNTASTRLRAPSTPWINGINANTIGTAPRSPDQERNACSRHGTLNGSEASTTDSGRATNVSTTPAISAGTSAFSNRPGEA